MYTLFMDAFMMLLDGLKFAIPATLYIWTVITTCQLCMEKRTRPSLMLLAATGYLMLLLYGTCFSRISSAAELFIWQFNADGSFFANEFSLTRRAMIWHEMLNVLLFVPWGFFAMEYSRGHRNPVLCVLSGVLMCCFVECFQAFHGLEFDLGDLLTNSLGSVTGVAVYAPARRLLTAISRRLSRPRAARRLPRHA